MFKRSVLTQFLLLLIPVYGLLFFGFNAFFKNQIETNFNETLFHKAFSITNTVALLAAAPLGRQQVETIPVLMSTLVADRDIEAIRIENLAGDTVYSYGNFDSVSGDLICKEVVSYANHSGIHAVGTVTLGLTRDRMWRLVDDAVSIVILGGLALLCSLIFVVIVAYRLTAGRQLSGLVASIRSFQETGIHEDAPASSDDQLGEVIRTYNAMQTDATEQRNEMERYSRRLSESIDIRTKAYSEEIDRHKKTADKLIHFLNSNDRSPTEDDTNN